MPLVETGKTGARDTASTKNGAAEQVCPTCEQPVSPQKYAEISGKLRMRDSQIEHAVGARFAAKERTIRQEAAVAAAAEAAAKLAKLEEQKKASEVKARAVEAETKRLLEAQRKALEKTADERVTVEREKRINENQRHQQELEAMRRRVARERPQDLGEEAEMNVFDLLCKSFPHDRINRVARGKTGGDVVHNIVQGGAVVGKMLFEVKNGKLYQYKWTAKAREDQITEQADHVIVVTATFPKGHRELAVENGILITSPARLIAIVTWLRAQTIRWYALRLSSQERSSKAEKLYSFMVSDRVADRWDRMAQTMERMRESLRAERAAHDRIWSDRTDQIDILVMIRDEFVRDLDAIFEGLERSS